MKKTILLLCLILTTSICFSACNKTEKKVLPQAEIEEKKLPRFKDYIGAFINNDTEAINKLKSGEIAPCTSVSELLEYYLQDKDEDTCIRVVKLALDNHGEIVNSMDFSNPLIESCKLNYYKLTEYLLTTDAKKYINYPFSQYAPALFWAMQNKNVELVELLLKNGADPNSESHYARTYMDEINEFIADRRIAPETGNKLKELLIKYGYKENSSSN